MEPPGTSIDNRLRVDILVLCLLLSGGMGTSNFLPSGVTSAQGFLGDNLDQPDEVFLCSCFDGIFFCHEVELNFYMFSRICWNDHVVLLSVL